jgi:hypothetical protein
MASEKQLKAYSRKNGFAFEAEFIERYVHLLSGTSRLANPNRFLNLALILRLPDLS